MDISKILNNLLVHYIRVIKETFFMILKHKYLFMAYAFMFILSYF
jgi:hypothetical protein